MTLNEDIILQFILDHGHTKKSFAELAGINIATVWNLLKGGKVSIKTLGLVAKATGIPYKQLLKEGV